MRNFIYLLSCLLVIVTAYWAYTENYSTQATIKRVQKLQEKIARERETITVLRAEWAYLNRPDRLRELADLNFERLGLIPLSPQHFGEVNRIIFPLNNVESEAIESGILNE